MLTKRCARHPRRGSEPNLGCAIIVEPLPDITRLARNTEPSVRFRAFHRTDRTFSRSSFAVGWVSRERRLWLVKLRVEKTLGMTSVSRSPKLLDRRQHSVSYINFIFCSNKERVCCRWGWDEWNVAVTVGKARIEIQMVRMPGDPAASR